MVSWGRSDYADLMTKHSLPPKGSAIDRPQAESTSPEPASVLPREIAGLTRPAQPKVVADAELDRPEEGVDPTLPENPVRGAPGHQVKEPRTDDEEEDEEGRSTTEQLIDAGAQEAEQDKVKQASRAAPRSDRS